MFLKFTQVDLYSGAYIRRAYIRDFNLITYLEGSVYTGGVLTVFYRIYILHQFHVLITWTHIHYTMGLTKNTC